MTPKARVLFIVGSINQTEQLEAVADHMRDCDCRFSPYYGDLLWRWVLLPFRLCEMTIGGHKRRSWARRHLEAHNRVVDDCGREAPYDLIVTCSDLVMPRNVRGTPTVVVQEGIFDAEGSTYALSRVLPLLPRWLSGTAMTGLSGLYDVICVASQGYRDHLVARGVPAERVRVTGIPNFDDCARHLANDFPLRHYVLVCTSDGRETLKRDDRQAFLRHALKVADGRPLVFKLHPNEDAERATAEIRQVVPDARVFRSGNTDEMIANCDVLVTEWSSVVFVGMALGKECHSYFDPAELQRLAPMQNGGTSAKAIAAECRALLGLPGVEVEREAPKASAQGAFAAAAP